jgi:hypothetical protein
LLSIAKLPEVELSDTNQSIKLDLRFGKKAGVLCLALSPTHSGKAD